jgi:hypothetical protein
MCRNVVVVCERSSKPEGMKNLKWQAQLFPRERDTVAAGLPRKRRKEMAIDPSRIGYFGGCPECGNNGYVNIGRSHWNICEDHKVKWSIGANLFSSWHDETEEDWKRNASLIADFKEVEPVYLDYQTGKVITSEELDALNAARREQEIPAATGPGSDDEIGLVERSPNPVKR